jgi:hypothetical protein
MAAPIAHLPEKPCERDHNKQQVAVGAEVFSQRWRRYAFAVVRSRAGGCNLSEFERRSTAGGRDHSLHVTIR